MEFLINFNDKVRVQLTDHGVDILKKQHELLDAMLKQQGNTDGLGEFVVSIDEDGLTSFQLWQLMQTFGEHMVMGMNEPFEMQAMMTSAMRF